MDIVQILINLIAGALGGVGAGKASPNFDLDPQIVAACKERNPNFGKGGSVRTQSAILGGAQRSKARGTTREPLFVLRDLRTAKQSIQDQQKQIRGQYNRRHARNRKHQGFPRFVVTSKPLDLHGQRPIKNLTAAVTSTHGG
jgi:hypothetical protein